MDSKDFQLPPDHSVEEALEALHQADVNAVTLPPEVFYGLSDLSSEDVAVFAEEWVTLPGPVRGRTARLLVESSESNFEFQYHGVALAMLDDTLAEVRKAAVELLWENKLISVLERLLEMLRVEPEDVVRAEILSMLGQFILLGEYGDIPQENATAARAAALRLWQSDNESVLVRRRALEAFSNSSDKAVREMIRQAYDSREHDMRVSAVYAMGRSFDRHWKPMVMAELSSRDPEMQYEAVRASGQLEIEETLPALARFSMQDEDRELQEVSIWAMGEIGGSQAVEYLSQLADAIEETDPDLHEYVEDAIHNAQISLDIDTLSDEWGDV